MKVVIFSINPLFPKVVTGGASKHLYHIAKRLSKSGNTVKILCAQADINDETFNWGENIIVSPSLPFNIPFPQPYAISSPDLAMIIERVSQELQDADRFYIHDGEFLIPDVYESIPTIASFRDNVYPESILGSFIGKADDVICVSGFSYDVIRHTAGRFFHGLNTRMHQVNNGIDTGVFFPVDPISLAEELRIDIDNEFVLLHPHRPEPGKGLPETIQVVDRLVHQHDIKKIKVLIPEWVGSMVSSGDSAFYNSMMRFIRDLGLKDIFSFIPWMPIERMPELYSLGDVTLCLGNIVEAFGNVAYESLACGTPSIVARIGVHRTLMPDSLIDKVHYGDIDGAVDHVLAILGGKEYNFDDILSYMKTTMNYEHQVKAYAKIIENCKKREQLQFSVDKSGKNQAFTLAPWCYIDGERLFHDFQGRFEQAPELAELHRRSDVIRYSDAAKAGVKEGTWNSWLEESWIVPVIN